MDARNLNAAIMAAIGTDVIPTLENKPAYIKYEFLYPTPNNRKDDPWGFLEAAQEVMVGIAEQMAEDYPNFNWDSYAAYENELNGDYTNLVLTLHYEYNPQDEEEDEEKHESESDEPPSSE